MRLRYLPNIVLLSLFVIAGIILLRANHAGAVTVGDPDLVGLWHMDNDWTDASGSGNHGTEAAGAVFSTSARLGSHAGSFDGVDDYVAMGAPSSLVMTESLTISAWIYPTGVGSHATAGGIIVNKEGEYEIARFPDGSIKLALANTSPGWSWISTNYIAPLNTWTHLAWMYSVAEQQITIYANGELVYSVTGSGLIGDNNPDMNEFWVGGRQRMNQFFNGFIDEVAIYKRALTPDEIAMSYKRGLGLIGLWRMDGDWLDASGYDNHRSAFNGATFSSDARMGSNAGSFDGVDDYVGVMMDLPERNFTIELWAKTDRSGGLFSVNAGSYFGSIGADRHLYVNTNGYACFRVWAGGGWCTGKKVNDGAWHHWALTVETGVGQRAYIDGELAGSHLYDHSDFDWQDRITIGYSADAGYFTGLIDEVTLYNRALTPDETNKFYNEGLGRVGLWHLDGEPTDATGNGNDGTEHNGAGYSPTARVGSHAASFDGVDDYVTIPDSPTLHSDRNLTVTGWIYVNSFDKGWQSIYWKGNTPDCTTGCENREYTLWLNQAGYLHFTSTPVDRVGIGQLYLNTPAGTIQTGRWYHFGTVISSDQNFMKIYVDGVEKASIPYSASGIRDTSGPLMIGNRPSWDTTFNGMIDEVTVHNRVLSPKDIREAYDTAAPKVTIVSPGAGLTGDSTPLLRYIASSNSVVTVKVDGTIVSKVSGDSLDALTDGQHTVRVEATDTSGNTGFAEVIITVEASIPSAPSGLAATAVSSRQVDLSWTDNSGSETFFYIEEKIGASGTYRLLARLNANVTAYSWTGAAQNTEYIFRVRAYNGSGYSAYSNEADATTPVLSAPSALTASATASNQIDLTWTDSSNDETYFYLERKTGAAGTYARIAFVEANTTSYSDIEGLKQNTEYYYRLQAFNGNYSVYSDEARAVTLTLNAPSGLAATAVSGNRIDLSWTDNSDDEDRFFIERKTGADGTYSYLASVTDNVRSYSDEGLAQNTVYYYRMQAYNYPGSTSSYSNEASAATLTVNVPSGFAARAISSNQISLTWKDNSNEETYFYLERKTGVSGTYAQIARVIKNVTTYSDNGLLQNTDYYYRVRANSGSNYSAYSNETNAKTQVLAPPTGLSVTAVTSDRIDLAWKDNSIAETRFSIERKVGVDGTYAVIVTIVGANVTAYSNTRLTQNTEYYYRVRAENGTANRNYSLYSNEVNAATPTLSAPSGLTAKAVSSRQIDLSWTDNSNDERGFQIERKTGAAGTYAYIARAEANVTTFSSTGLAENTEYYYRVRAYNENNSSYSNESNATTLTIQAPSDLTAQAFTSNQIDLSWTDNSNDETYFYIERKIGVSGTYYKVAGVGANVTKYSHTGLTENTEYYYRVRAYNGYYSSYSNEAGSTTLTLKAPSDLTVQAVASNQIDLSWTDNSNDETYFYIDRKIGASGTYSRVAGVGANVTKYSHTGLTQNTEYYYRVRAYNGNYSTYTSEVNATTPIIQAPSGLTATAVSSHQIDLSWTDNSNDEMYFYIERKIGVSGTYSRVAGVGANVTKYSHTGLTQNTEYYYRVQAFNRNGNYSSYSNEVNATTLTLKAPTSLTITSVSSNQIDLSWTDNSNDETSFYIERKTGVAGSYVRVANVGANVTTYSNDRLAQNTEYYYRVRAYNAYSGNYSSYTNETSATTLTLNAPSALTATTVSSGQIDLSWKDNSIDETDFYLERKTGISGTYAYLTRVNANVTSYSDPYLRQNTEYYYRIRAEAGSGNYSPYANEANAITLTLNAPTGLAATAVSSYQVDLSWTDNSNDEQNFVIERKLGATGAYAYRDRVYANDTSYSDRYLNQNTEYFYRVRTSNTDNYSSYSNESSATLLTLNAPSDLIATAVSPTQIDLAWTDNSNDEVDFYIEKKTGASGIYSQIARVTADVTSYSVKGYRQNTTYYFRIRARSGSNFSSYSNEAVATTDLFTITPLPAVGGVISPSESVSVTFGGSKTFTIAENAGYNLLNVAADGIALGPVTTYTFTNVTANHNISASFDDVAEPAGTVAINNGATATNNTKVTLALNAIDNSGSVASVRFSNDETAWSTPQPYASTKSWTITPGEGTKTVYVKFGDDADNWSGAYSDTIILDTTPPVVTIASPVEGLTKENKPLLAYTYTETGCTVAVKVDGVIVPKVSGNRLDSLTDGVHTVRVEARDPGGNVGIDAVTFTVDATAPVLTIEPVTSPTNQTSQTITGTMESGSTITVSVNTTATAGLVTYPTTSTWSSPITGLVEGDNVITVTATDTAENTTAATTLITLRSITISNVGVGSHTINTVALESTSIFYTIDAPATVTLKIVPEVQGPFGSPVYQAEQAVTAAGAYFLSWDGRNSTGSVVPDEAYLYVLEAVDGTKTGLYSPPALRGTGSVSCTQGAGYDVFKNEPLVIDYSLTEPERIDLKITWDERSFKLMDSVPHVAGSYTFDWDGRHVPTGTILKDNGTVVAGCSARSVLPENHIITTGDTPNIAGLKTDPYRMNFSYGQFTRIKYDISRDANVTIKLIAPSGSAATLVNSQLQTAGEHEIEWTGLDAADATEKKFLVSEDGTYTILIKAVNPDTGSSSEAKGVLVIKR